MPRKKPKTQVGVENANQGQLGQDLFATWATMASVVANPASKDLSGWDFLVDLPPPKPQGYPKTCKVQVKTLADGESNTQVRLSNCRRMVVEAIPWFIVIIRFGANGDVKDVGLIAVVEDVIKRMVESIATMKSGKKQLNRRRLTFGLAGAKAVAGPPFHQSLFAEMRSAIGDQHAHVLAKQAARKSAQEAHPESSGSFKVKSTSNDEAFRAMAEFAVGIREDLPLERFSLSERVLGVEGPEEVHTNTSLKLPDLPSVGKSRLVVSQPTKFVRLERSFETHFAHQVFPFLPRTHALARLVSPYLTIILESATSKFRFNFLVERLKGKEPVSASELGQACEFFLALGDREGRDTRAELFLPKAETPVVLKPNLSRSTDISTELKEVLTTCRNAWRVLDRLGMSEDLVSPLELQARSKMIGVCAEALSGRPPEMGVSFTIPESAIDSVVTSETATTFVMRFPTSTRSVFVVLALMGRPSRVVGTSDQVEMPAGRPEVLLTEVLPRAHEQLSIQNVLVSMRERAGTLLEERGVSEVVHLD